MRRRLRCSSASHLRPLHAGRPDRGRGGLNLYGYALGDPVNDSDPFGLTVCFKGAGAGRNLRHLEQAIDADIDAGEGCVTQRSQVRPRGRDISPLARMFLSLVESSEEYAVQDGRTPFRCSASPSARSGPGSGYCEHTVYVDASDFARVWRADGFGCNYWGRRIRMNRQHVIVHELLGHGLGGSGVAALSVENTFRKSQGGAPRCADGAHR